MLIPEPWDLSIRQPNYRLQVRTSWAQQEISEKAILIVKHIWPFSCPFTLLLLIFLLS